MAQDPRCLEHGRSDHDDAPSTKASFAEYTTWAELGTINHVRCVAGTCLLRELVAFGVAEIRRSSEEHHWHAEVARGDNRATMKGPKGLIAEAIANALAEFFVIDQKTMEARLLNNAAIVLRDTKLKPVHCQISPRLAADITGVVEHVAFEWHWGNSDSGGSDWIKDSKLVIEGINCTVVLSECADGRQPQADPTATDDEKEEAKGFMVYIQDQVDRIIDTVSLSVKTFELTVTLPNGQSLILGADSLGLASLGRVEEGEPLHQELSVTRLVANILVDGHLYPVVEPVGYKASCVRVSGKRFVSGIDKGLEVTGESQDGGIVIHTGAEQIVFFNMLIGLFLVTTPPTSVSADVGMDDGVEVTLGEEELLRQKSEKYFKFDPNASGIEVALGEEELLRQKSYRAISFDSGAAPESAVDQSGGPSSTVLHLPLSAVTLVFPNGTKISLSKLVAKYRMDGSMLIVEGNGGFLVNDFKMLSLGQQSRWCADVLNNLLTIYSSSDESSHNEDLVAFIHARDVEIKSIQGGLDGMTAILDRIQDGAVKVLAESEPSPPESAPSWTVELSGQLGVLWEGPAAEEACAELTIRDIHASMETMTAAIHAIEKMYIPGVIRLSEPIVWSTIRFNGSVFNIKVGDIFATLEEAGPASPTKVPPTRTFDAHNMASSISTVSSDDGDSVSTTDGPFILLFGVLATIDNITLYDAAGDEKQAVINDLQLALGPNSNVEAADDVIGGIRTALIIADIDHDLIHLKDLRLSAVLHLEDLDTIQQVNFEAKEIVVTAGYTALDWQRLLHPVQKRRKKRKRRQKHKQPKEPLKPINLPFAHVEPLKIKVGVSGDLVGFAESALHIKAFKGRLNTTSDHLISYYSQRVVSRVPNLIVNTELLGTNAADTAVGQLGSVTGVAAMGAGGAAFGGVAGLAAFDGVRNTITVGKESRGAESDDKTQFFDFARGLKHAAIHATRDGAKKRGKGDDQVGDPLDWAIGASVDIANYTNNNKSRLGGAGAATIGFLYGMAFGGPVGAVAGALVASTVTSATIDKLSETLSPSKKLAIKALETHSRDLRRKSIFESVEQTVEDVEEQKKADEEAAISVEVNLKENPIPLRGILLKRRDFFVWDWHAHYFVLDGDEVKYYSFSNRPTESEEDTSRDEEGMLYVANLGSPLKALTLTGFSATPEDELSKPEASLFVFKITSPKASDPSWILAAGSLETRREWIARIGEAT